MGERFFDIDVLAERHRLHGNWKMGMIGRSDDYSVDVLFLLVEHLAEIGIAGDLHRQGFEKFGAVIAFEVDIANRDNFADLFFLEPLADLSGAIAATDDGQSDFGIRAYAAGMGGEDIDASKHADGKGLAEKRAAVAMCDGSHGGVVMG